jgi:hypothetical protein
LSNQESKQVLELLKELATLKDLDRVSAADSHQQRREEIAAQIKTIAEQKENGAAPEAQVAES